MKLAVPDLISNSYFPALAAAELGCFKDEGLDVEVELMFPVDRAYRALAAGEVDFVGGCAHGALAAFPEWTGVKLLCAQAQGMYWFLVMRADLQPKRGDLSIVKGRTIGAAPWVDMGLKTLLVDAGIDLVRDDVTIAPVPGAATAGVNFGVTAARALAEGRIDGFWANGMGTEVAVRSGAGVVVLDVRRGDGPNGCFDYTFAAIAASDRLLAQAPEAGAGVVRSIAAAHAQLKRDPVLATHVGEKHFPPHEAGLIADLIARDLPYYDTGISERAVRGVNHFAQRRGILTGNPRFEDVVAMQYTPLWRAA